jgi:hypothetical protein
MKTNTLKAAAAVGLTALLLGSAAAQESKSKPVGYETLSYTAGFNYLGLRLVEAPTSSGASVAADGATVTVEDGVADSLTAGVTYLFEATSGDAAGVVTTVASFDAAADTLTLSDDISGDFEAGSEFIVRPVDTLASVFGVENDVANSSDGLESTGSFGTCDQIWVPDGTGSFAKYAYVKGNPFLNTADGWQDAAGTEITDPTTIQLVYVDGIIVNGAQAGDLVVSGSVKLEPVSFALTAKFNYVSSVFPAGLNLTESELQSSLSSTGSFGTSDQVWLADGAGGFSKYAFVKGNPFLNTPDAWQDESSTIVADPSAITFDGNAGMILVRGGDTVAMVKMDSPDFYDTL